MGFVLGIDVGTINIKATVLDNSDRVISFTSGRSRIKIYDNLIEQDPEEIWCSVIKVIRRITKDRSIKRRLTGLSLSTQGGTLIAVDKNNKVLRPAITWMDTRAKEEGERLIKKYGKRFFYHLTGWVPDKGSLPLLQILGLQKNEKEVFRKTKKYHFIDSFLINKLTGKDITDPTNAAITMLYDIKRWEWSERLLEILKIKKSQLPEIIPSGDVIGQLTPEASKILDLPSNVILYNGGHDQYCSALGAGVTEPGEVLLSAGTAWVILAITKKPVFLPMFQFFPGPHVVEEQWGLLTSIPCGGASFDWFLKKVLNKRSYQEVDEMVKNVKAEGLFFRPPYLDNGGGIFSGLSINHNQSHFLRSIMEGLAFEVRKMLDILQKNGISIKKLKMVGGGAKSSIWPRVISDIINLPVVIPNFLETASFGASLLCKKKQIKTNIKYHEQNDSMEI